MTARDVRIPNTAAAVTVLIEPLAHRRMSKPPTVRARRHGDNRFFFFLIAYPGQTVHADPADVNAAGRGVELGG